MGQPRNKNSGELLTTTQVGSFDSLPPQLRAALTVITQRQGVNLDTEPEAVSGGVIQSATLMDQTNEFKKETIRASFPITVTSQARTDEYGGGTITLTDTYSLTPPTAPAGSLTIVEHRVENLGTVYHERKEEKTTASWPVLYGQQYLDDLDFTVQFTETINTPGTSLGDARTEITPLDDKRQRVRVITANTAALDAYSVSLVGTADIQLPDVLESVTVVWNNDSADTTSSHLVADQGFVVYGSGSGSLDPDARASASASLVPDLQIVRRQTWGQDIPVTFYLFYVANGSTLAQILARLTTLASETVNQWPVFQPKSHTFSLKSARVSVSAQADSHAAMSFSVDNDDVITSSVFSARKGSGQGVEISTSTRTVEIPPTIHAGITLSDTSRTLTPTVTVKANTMPLLLNGVEKVSTIVNEPTATSKAITAEVLPISIAATSPATIPTSGLYARRIESEVYRWGYTRVRATVVDCSVFA